MNCAHEHANESWEALEEVGKVDFAGMIVEYRNCTCGSTIGREVKDQSED